MQDKYKIRWDGTTEDDRTTDIVWSGYRPCWYPDKHSDCVIADMYFEDFDVTGDGSMDISDVSEWNSIGRIDIQQETLRIVLTGCNFGGETEERGCTFAPITTYTWGDVALLVELVGGGISSSARKRKLKKLDKEKKKQLIRLICKVKGEKVYDEEKEVGNIEIKLSDVDMVIEAVLGKIKIEGKDVL